MDASGLKDHNAAALASAIGQKVRQERQGRGWTLDRLAVAAGVSRRMLINVEQGAANPSVGTLLKLSDALGIGLPALVEWPDRSPLKVTRRGDSAVLWSGDAGGQGVLVAGTDPPNVLELWNWTLQVGERHDSEKHAPGTWEMLQVVEGALTLEVDHELVCLDAGDAVSFAGDVGHAYVNETDAPVEFTLVVFEPGVGKGGR